MKRSEKFARFAGTEAVSGDLKRKSVLGALMTGAGGAGDFVLRLASTLILARLLVPEDFGLVAMVTVIAGMAERFSTLGLSAATVQAPKITDGQCSNLFWINAAAGMAFAALLVLLSPAIASFYEDARLQPISVAISLNFIWTGLAVQHEALLRRQMKLPQIAGNRLAATFISAGIGVALALSGFGYWALVWKEVIRSAAIAIGAWALCPWVPARPSRRENMHRLLTFGRDMTLTQVLLSVSGQLDSLLVGKFSGAAELGLYRQADNLMKAPIERLNAPITTVSQSGLSILQREPARYRRYYQRILFVVSLFTIPLGVFTAVYAHEIVLVVLGQKWLGATVFLRIFALLASIRPAMATSAVVMVTCGQSGRFLKISLAYSAALLTLMLTGINWGPVGIAAAHLATAVLVTPWMLSYSFAGSPVSIVDFWRSFSRPFVASLTMGAALLLLRNFAQLQSALLSLAAGSGAAITVYLLTLNVLPGGRGQLQSLAGEILAALRRRSSAGVEASKGGRAAH